MKTLIDKLTGEKIDPNNDIFYDDRFGNVYNQDSYQYLWENPSTVVEISPDGVKDLKFTKEFGMLDDEDYEPSLKMPEPIKEEKWVSSSAWRGYTDWVLNKGYKEYSEGWITGYPDETTKRKADLAELYEKLKSGELVPPVTIWWVFGVTSNIFSTASAILIKTKDEKKLNKWLESIGYSKEQLDYQLS